MNFTKTNWVVAYMLDRGKIDKTDAIILDELLENSRQSVTEIAKRAKVSRPTVYERIERMMEKGYIRNYTIDLNYDKCGLPVTAYILVNYDGTKDVEGSSKQKSVAKKLSELDNVRQVNIITGSHDFLVEISIDHMHSLAEVIIENMRQIAGVGNTITMVSFMEFKQGKSLNTVAENYN